MCHFHSLMLVLALECLRQRERKERDEWDVLG